MEHWDGGDLYEVYMGRWSRQVAHRFVSQVAFRSPNGRWLDLGCGTGALTQAVLEARQPEVIVGVDASVGFVRYTRQRVQDRRARFVVANATALPFPAGAFTHVVSGLVLNFLPEVAVQEMRRVTRKGGFVAAYVWDYAGQMEWLRFFWDAAIAVNPEAEAYDEGQRFPICNPDNLMRLFARMGLDSAESVPIDVPTHFEHFEDYWRPFLSGQFPAPQYAASLTAEGRAALRATLQQRVPTNRDGSIDLVARAWSVSGIVRE